MSKKTRDRVATAPLALRYIDDNLCFTSNEVWAWFRVPTQPWAFRSDLQREQLLFGAGDALAWLAGHRLHLRVTARPYPTAEWARRLHQLTPQPLQTPGVQPWTDHLVRMQQHLRHQTMAEKQVFLGVRLSTRPLSHRVTGAVWRHPGNVEHARLLPHVERVTETMALPGMEGRPASAREMEWLMRRSVGLGLPAPVDLAPLPDGGWSPADLHSFTDRVEYYPERFGRTVRLVGRGTGDPVERHIAVMSVGRLEEIEAPDPGHEPWLSHTDHLPFPVEWSCYLDVLSGADARKAIQKKLLVVRDMQRHFGEHDLDEPLALDRQARQAREVEDQMTRGVDVTAARVHGWFRLAVAGRTEEECLERVRKVTTSYRSRRVTIEHPRGQFGLLREFIPGEPISTSAYRRRLPALYVSAGVPQASTRVGDRRGPYLGYTAGSSRQAVMFDTHYATEVKETSGLVPVVGGLGAGKSVLIGQITYEAVRRGIPAVVLDPSGPLARLTHLPELREHSEHLDLTTAASGTLNPFEVVASPLHSAYDGDEAYDEAQVLAAQDRKLLAMDVVKMLLPAAVDTMAQTSLVVSDAVRATRGEPTASLWDVVEHLERHSDPHGRVVANYLRDMAELPLSRLFFPRSSSISANRMGARLTVLTMPGLVLPPKSVPREHWSTSEQLAVPLLHLASWYATRAVYGREMQSRKLVALDETHFLGEWSAGRALFTRLGRDSRKWNTCVLAASHRTLSARTLGSGADAAAGRYDDELARWCPMRGERPRWSYRRLCLQPGLPPGRRSGLSPVRRLRPPPCLGRRGARGLSGRQG
ncbi:ATP-binding protein [Nocardioides houyundeii]|uniref:ATP-binding protein n=1 Tax=Nocardioides houyundeii TaxID=2045452 RepID=UPI000DF31B21|nr:ATP-binding protein [Nocardioides houyundeii]